MAAKKNATTENKENNDMQSSQDLKVILEMMQSMKQQVDSLVQENEALKAKMKEMDSVEKTVEIEEEIISQPIFSSPIVEPMPQKIKVYHMQELVGGTVTYIKLSNTTRTLQHMGQVMTLDINDFEELEGKYRHYFDKGVLALDADYIEYANMYSLPIYDSKTKAQYNAKVLKDVVNYNYEKLQSFYNSLSETNKNSFLNYWLGQVYDKIPGYYNMEKMRWLNSISGMEVFSTILVELENENRRKQQNIVDGNKM